MILLIRNIDRALTQAEIHTMLARYGQVESFDLVMDQATGGSKGFGFAKMRTDAQASLIIRELDGRQMGASRLRVKKAAASSLRKGRRMKEE